MRKFGYYLGVAQILIFILMSVIYQHIGLLPYINSSFIVGGTLLFIGMVVYVVSSGFFDVFTLSFRKMFTPKNRMKDIMEMRSPSDAMSFSYGPLLVVGSTIILIMSVCLFIYYM